MSYDLVFWRQTALHGGRPVDIYRSLCGNERVDGVGELTVEEIRTAFAVEFPDLRAETHELLGPMFSVMLYTRPIRIVVVTCSWHVGKQPDIIERIVRVGRDHLGCCYFNPQSGEFSEGPPLT
jgi:hypothetical protein